MYDATRQAAKELLAEGVGPVRFEPPTALTRYVPFRDGRPQEAADASILHRPVGSVRDHRWDACSTGTDEAAPGDHLAMYFSEDRPGPGSNRFVEYRHHARETAGRATVELEGGDRATLDHPASMFLWTVTVPLPGADVSLNGRGKPGGAGRPFLTAVLRRVIERHPALFPEGRRNLDALLDRLYYGEDASFDRAIGNALLEVFRCVRVASVRSVPGEVDHNILIRAEEGVAVAAVRPEGRATIGIAEDGELAAVFSKGDLRYNARFDRADPEASTRRRGVVEAINGPTDDLARAIEATEVKVSFADRLVDTLPDDGRARASGRGVERQAERQAEREAERRAERDEERRAEREAERRAEREAERRAEREEARRAEREVERRPEFRPVE